MARIGLLVALVVAAAAAGWYFFSGPGTPSALGDITTKPPRSAQSEPLEPLVSRIAVSLQADLKTLERRINQEVPDVLEEQTHIERGCIKKKGIMTFDCRIKLRVTKAGSVRLRGKGEQLFLSVPFDLKLDILTNPLKLRAGADVRLAFEASMRPTITPDWVFVSNLKGTLKVKSKGKAKFLDSIKYDVTDRLQGAIKEQSPKINQRLKRISTG